MELLTCSVDLLVVLTAENRSVMAKGCSWPNSSLVTSEGIVLSGGGVQDNSLAMPEVTGLLKMELYSCWIELFIKLYCEGRIRCKDQTKGTKVRQLTNTTLGPSLSRFMSSSPPEHGKVTRDKVGLALPSLELCLLKSHVQTEGWSHVCRRGRESCV